MWTLCWKSSAAFRQVKTQPTRECNEGRGLTKGFTLVGTPQLQSRDTSSVSWTSFPGRPHTYNLDRLAMPYLGVGQTVRIM